MFISQGTSLPAKMSDAAVIENPSDSNELLIIGGKRITDIYIYNKTSKKFSKSPNDNLTKILYKHEMFRYTIHKIYAFKGILNDTLIIVTKGTISFKIDGYFKIER